MSFRDWQGLMTLSAQGSSRATYMAERSSATGRRPQMAIMALLLCTSSAGCATARSRCAELLDAFPAEVVQDGQLLVEGTTATYVTDCADGRTQAWICVERLSSTMFPNFAGHIRAGEVYRLDWGAPGHLRVSSSSWPEGLPRVTSRIVGRHGEARIRLISE